MRLIIPLMSTMTSLRKNLTNAYPFGGPMRSAVPSDYTDWKTNYDEYTPPDFTIPAVLKGDKPWTDPEIGAPQFTPKFNDLDGPLNRRSWEGNYLLDKNGYPLNPVGRTGLKGRGRLGRWGPNHAADCIITRWKWDGSNQIIYEDKDKTPLIQFIAISRGDTGEIAIPGGMVDPGEDFETAAQREFVEEVIGIPNIAEADSSTQEALKNIFQNGNVITKGYVDDHRNTDNAWIETYAINYHISEPENILNKMKFKSGSDAKAAFWVDYTTDLNLYASHGNLLRKAVSKIHEMHQGTS